jgi:catechol 2,3-dioxygenase-like lactoylglutathione lyase family enzyme
MTAADNSHRFVTGLGGVFFRARDPDGLAAWYRDHFGIDPVPSSYEAPCWQQQAGPTVFAPFRADTDYFGRPEQAFMVNLRVRNLDALATRLRTAGIEVRVDPEAYPNGRFARVHDPEGNPIELWQPSTPADAPLARWHDAAASRDPERIPPLLADDAVFHSPVVNAPQAGKPVVAAYLSAAFAVLGAGSFRYVREVESGRDAVLEFESQIDDTEVNGVDLIRWNEAGLIVDFKVMLRPARAITVVQERMAAMLARLARGPA